MQTFKSLTTILYRQFKSIALKLEDSYEPEDRNLVFDVDDVFSVEAGTSQVTLLSPGVIATTSFTLFGTSVLYAGLSHDNGTELWRTDGTVAGTQLFHEFEPGMNGSNVYVRTTIGNTAIVSDYKIEFDGTNVNLFTQIFGLDSLGIATKIIERSGFLAVTASSKSNGKVLVSLSDNAPNTYELFATDGVSATSLQLPTDVSFSADLANSVTWNGAWYVPTNSFVSPNYLWKVSSASLELNRLDDTFDDNINSQISNPIATSTGVFWTHDYSILNRTTDGLNVESRADGIHSIRNLGAFNGGILFSGDSVNLRSMYSVSQSDLSFSTLLQPNALPTFSSLSQNNSPSLTLGTQRYFFADSNGYSQVLWRTDGTEAGTVLVSNEISATLQPQFAVLGDQVYIMAQYEAGFALWRVIDPVSTTEPRSVELVKTFRFYYAPDLFVSVGSRLVIGGLDFSSPYPFHPVYFSDGTANGTVLSTVLGSIASTIQSPVVLNNIAYFSTFTLNEGNSVWRTNGTDTGTLLVESGSSAGWYDATTDGKSIFWAGNDRSSTLYRSDDGMLTRQKVGQARVLDMVAQSGLLYYFGNADVFDRTQIYRTDGSIGPATLVATAEQPSSFPPKLIPMGSGMSIYGYFNSELKVLVDRPGAPAVASAALSTFLLNGVAWGSLELGQFAVGPVDFPQYGLEPGRIAMPASIKLSQRVIEENKPAGAIGNLSLAWYSGVSSVSYGLVTGEGNTDNSSFSLSPTGQLSSLRAFDSDVQPMLSIRVRASSGNSVVAEEAVTFLVRDIFDGVEFLTLSNNKVMENYTSGRI